MFKKSAALKTSTRLKSSERRALLAHLQAAYPVLAHAPADVLARLVPEGLRQANALTSAEDKCCFFTDDDGIPLWFELGGHVGVALSAGKGSKNKHAGSKKGGGGAGGSSISSSSVARVEGEVIPTLNALWIHPFILPHLPTWPTVIEDHLLGGSALMVPGLRLPPNTFRPCPLQLPTRASPGAEEQTSPAQETATAAPPAANTLVAITTDDSIVPLVVGRLELSGEKLAALRSQPGGKGKAARVIHSYRDTIWELGGKLKPPADADFDLAALVQQPGEGESEEGKQDGATGENPADVTGATGAQAEDQEEHASAAAPPQQQEEEEEEEEDLAAALEAVLMGAGDEDEEEEGVEAATDGARKGKGKGKKGKKQNRRGHAGEGVKPDAAAANDGAEETAAPTEEPAGPTLSAPQIDTVLRLALLNALASFTAESASALLPLPASSLYSAHVLPNRPSHLPPRVGKGKGRAKAPWEGWETWKTRTTIDIAAVEKEEGEETSVPVDEAEVKRSSAKQLKKWIKGAEKDGLLKTKEVRGELTIVDLSTKHSELQGWTPVWTVADEAARAAAEDDIGGGDGTSGTASKKAKNAPDRMGILMQSFFGTKTEATRELFEVFGLDPDSIQSASSLRAALSDYITKRALAHPTNQALVRPGDDPALVLALTSAEGGKSKKKGDAANAAKPDAKSLPELKPMRRDEVAKKLQDVMQEYHRLSFVRTSTANAILTAQARNDPLSTELLESEPFKASLKEGELIGTLNKGKPVPISVSIKQRQGRKTVTLISGLEPYGVDPKALATELSHEVGASTSVSSLPGSTAKKPKVEVLVQGDVRKTLFKYLEEEAGLDVARLVVVKDDVGGKKK
ncbi:hypothetical protein OC842_007707 [Tilletia horrida]|uniref:SUI1 domain-containing protein n=1 Tax=Tilletia horrida TaxID=155126 RepID=A0AAN6G3E2_9BASI|nr:hypothetical protein OC842_007707 [Tilletia horrida]